MTILEKQIDGFVVECYEVLYRNKETDRISLCVLWDEEKLINFIQDHKEEFLHLTISMRRKDEERIFNHV